MADLTIEDLDPTQVAQAEEVLIQFLRANYPSLDLSEGRVLRNLLIRPAATFHVLNRANIATLQQSQSMVTIAANPSLADPSYVDAVLSNYRIVRNTGAIATGLVTIVIQNLLTTSVAQGTLFSASGLIFSTAWAYVGVTSSDAVLNDQQRLITQRTDGLYVFTIPVQASQIGEAYNAKKNTRFTVDPSPAGMIDAYAAQDFTGGLNSQTNADMVAEFEKAISPQVFSGRIQISSLIQEKFPYTKAMSIIGFGDEEMLRDRHNIFEVSHGGKADLYVRSQTLPELHVLAKTATLISKADKKWQITLSRDDAPGFYTVESVLPTDADQTQDSLLISSESRGMDLTPENGLFIPSVANVTEGAYSRYQTAVVQFIDPTLDYSLLTELTSTKVYNAYVLSMPNVKEMQYLASDRGYRNPQADYLVRAPIPAFVAVTLKVLYQTDGSLPDVAAIQQNVADRVNGVNFSLGQLPASLIYDAVHDIISKTQALVVSPIDILCRIHKPTGQVLQIRSGNGIDVPDLPDECVTSRTVIFYLQAENVDVEIEKVPILPV